MELQQIKYVLLVQMFIGAEIKSHFSFSGTWTASYVWKVERERERMGLDAPKENKFEDVYEWNLLLENQMSLIYSVIKYCNDSSFTTKKYSKLKKICNNANNNNTVAIR